MQVSQVTADAHRPADGSKLPETRPVIIVVSGLPGTGKSFFSRRLAELLPYVIVESDALRKKLFPKPSYSASESAYLFRAIHYLIEELLKKGVSIIFDATNLAERHRTVVYRIAERANARLILVRVHAPPELVHKRLKSRVKQADLKERSDADWAVYQKLKAAEERITRRHFTVNTSRDITPVIDKIVREANR